MMTKLDFWLARRTWRYRPIPAGVKIRDPRLPQNSLGFKTICLLCLAGYHTEACGNMMICPRNDPRNRSWQCRTR